jgi:hypothetical protein
MLSSVELFNLIARILKEEKAADNVRTKAKCALARPFSLSR